MLDADGCITMYRNGTFRKPVIVVDNTDREIIDELVRLHGGSVVRKKKYSAHHRQAWSWRVLGTNNIIAFLEKVYPFMRCAFKRERARMFLEEWREVTPRNGRYTPEQRRGKMAFEKRFMNLGAGRGKRSYTEVKP